jgi:hypothetical protein
MAKHKGLERHSVDIAAALESLPSYLEMLKESIGAARLKADLLWLAGQTGLQLAGRAAVVAAERPEVCKGLKSAADCQIAIMLLAGDSKDTAIIIDGAPAMLSKTGPTGYANLANWRTAFLLACICRRRAERTLLCQMSHEVFRASRTKSDPAFYKYLDAISAFALRAEDGGSKLLEALNALHPDLLKMMSAEFALDILTPEIEMAFRLADGDAAGFNKSVTFAIERHKSYWSKGDRKGDPVGYLALGAIAFSSLAVDTGIEVDVDSDYLPMTIVRGSCEQ